MSDVYTTGVWTVSPGNEDAFIEAWTEFAGWASAMPGAGVLSLARDLGDPQRFVSFGAWQSLDQVHGWKRSPEFRERMGRVQQHVASFQPAELEVVATANGGASEAGGTGVAASTG